MLEHRITLVLLSLLVGCVTVARRMEGPHQETLSNWEAYLVWCAWWVGLGVLSSVGLGTGLHTFLLYLGPHIASVTLAGMLTYAILFCYLLVVKKIPPGKFIEREE